jgi:hypothetical protein
MNKRKGKLIRTIWLTYEEEQRLRHALDGNFNDEVLDIIFSVYKRGDFLC